MNTLIALVIAFILNGSDTTLTCQDATAALPHSNADRVVFVLNNTEYLAVYNETDNGKDWYSFAFPNDGQGLEGQQTFRQVIIDGEIVNIANPLTVTCHIENPDPSHKQTIFLPIVVNR